MRKVKIIEQGCGGLKPGDVCHLPHGEAERGIREGWAEEVQDTHFGNDRAINNGESVCRRY